MVDLNLEQIPQKTFVKISILGGRFLVGFLEYKTDGSSTFQVPIGKIEKTSLCYFVGMWLRERWRGKMWHRIRQKASSAFANVSCKHTEFFQVHLSEEQMYNTDIKYDTFKQHCKRQWDLYGNVTSFLLPVLNLVYLQVVPPAPQWNVIPCHKFNCEAIFPDYLTKVFTWMTFFHIHEE